VLGRILGFVGLFLGCAACGGASGAGAGARDSGARDAAAADAASEDSRPGDAAPDGAAPDGAAPDAGGPPAAVADDASTDAGPADPRIAARRFGALQPWARPIDDYLAAGEAAHGAGGFLRGVHDIQPFDGRLFLGYGDANVNMGRLVPIEVRAFDDPARPTATAEFATDDEHVERYRRVGARLWIAGVDATEDAWLGNLYERPAGGSWTKHRTVRNGVHVHDVGAFDGAAWAVGSGATPDEWGAGDIHAHLWRTYDAGASIAVVARHHNGGAGDARWVRLLPVTGGAAPALFVFGYTSDARGSIATLPHGTVGPGEGAVTPLAAGHPLQYVFVTETDPLPDGAGLVRGVEAARTPLLAVTHHVTGRDAAAPVAHLAGRTVVDVSLHEETGELLVLSEDGDDYLSGLERSAWTLRLEVTADVTDERAWSTLLEWQADVRPRSVAYWRGALYHGDDDGTVWRAEGVVSP
jgi:hypothetical protein